MSITPKSKQNFFDSESCVDDLENYKADDALTNSMSPIPTQTKEVW